MKPEYRVVVSPSIFRENEELGRYQSYWRAWFAAVEVIMLNSQAEAYILKRIK